MMTMISASHDFYKVPVYHIDAVEDIRLTDTACIYHINIGDGMLLSSYVRANLSDSDFMRISFHGARSAKTSLPYFLRVTSSLDNAEPFVLFSDPTLGLDSGNLISWYSGTSRIIVDDIMERQIRHVSRLTKSSNAVFEGSSGGGFVSLRMSARFSRSVAVAFSPQTDIFRYEPAFGKRIRRKFYNQASERELKMEYPGRFNVGDIYASGADRGNLIEYAQNSGDTFHVEQHLIPFCRELGLPDDAVGGLLGRLVIKYEDLGTGHFPHPGDLWDEIVSDAMKRLVEYLRDTNYPAIFDEPPYYADEHSLSTLSSYCKSTYLCPASDDAAMVAGLVVAGGGREVDRDAQGITVRLGESDTEIFARLSRWSSTGAYIRIFLHGPVDRQKISTPYFETRFSSPSDGSILDVAFSDPSLDVEESIRVGWYIGNEKWNPLEKISKYIDELLSLTDAKFAVIIGASSAGLAALQLGSMKMNRRVVAFCPELSINHVSGSFVDAFRKAAFPSYKSFSSLSRSAVSAGLFEDASARYVLLSNPSAQTHMQHYARYSDEIRCDVPNFDLKRFFDEANGVFGEGQTAPSAAGAKGVIESACIRWVEEDAQA